jgi:hypothetical protein
LRAVNSDDHRSPVVAGRWGFTADHSHRAVGLHGSAQAGRAPEHVVESAVPPATDNHHQRFFRLVHRPDPDSLRMPWASWSCSRSRPLAWIRSPRTCRCRPKSRQTPAELPGGGVLLGLIQYRAYPTSPGAHGLHRHGPTARGRRSRPWPAAPSPARTSAPVAEIRLRAARRSRQPRPQDRGPAMARSALRDRLHLSPE